MKRSEGGIKIILKNKKAFHNFHILERYEAGIELTGTEIKSIREGSINMGDAYCRISKSQELHVINMNISQYTNGTYSNHDPLRKRRLLLHKREIRRFRSKLLEKGYTLVPICVYFKRGWAKLELGLAKGKARADKREALKKREAKREIHRYHR